jgi:hypothetical protein
MRRARQMTMNAEKYKKYKKGATSNGSQYHYTSAKQPL